MKKLVKITFVVISLAGLTFAQAQTEEGFPHVSIKKDVRECGDLETAVGLISGGLVLGIARNASLESTLLSQATANYFLAKFQACKCRIKLADKWSYQTVYGCFVKAYASATLYRNLDISLLESDADLADVLPVNIDALL